VIRIRKGSSNGVELTGLQLDEERKQCAGASKTPKNSPASFLL
ncbi:hypothetical protein ACUODF_50455, partial [Escherichia coli]